LLLLLFNDHYFKFAFSNWLTGKLSDVAGIILLPLLLLYVFPQLKKTVLPVSAMLFIFWKSPLSQGTIDWYNSFAILPTSRIVDYTDLIALFFLPIPYFIITSINRLQWLTIRRLNPAIILLPTLATLMATSPPPAYYYTRSNGNLTCYKCNCTIDYSQEEIVNKLKANNIVFDSITSVDSSVLKRVPKLKKENAHFYKISTLIIDKDTLKNLDFTMRTLQNGKTKIYFNGMQVSDDISTPALEKKLWSYYKRVIFTELKRTLTK
jgi:hypothetical protein